MVDNPQFQETNQLLLETAAEACKKWFSALPPDDATIKPYEPYQSGKGS